MLINRHLQGLFFDRFINTNIIYYTYALNKSINKKEKEETV